MTSAAKTENWVDTHPAPKVDWIHLPANTIAVSLWDSLHDGKLIAVRSDLLARTLILEFQIWHLNDYHGFSADCRFSFEFVNVSSVRATRWSPWPGDFEIPKGMPPIEQSRLVDEYQTKWREESYSWSSVEDRFMGGNVGELDISNASIAVGRDAAALRLETESNDQGFQLLTIAAESLRIGRMPDIQLSLEDFVRLGEDFWAAFANRSA